MGYPLFTNNAATGMVYPISSSATTLVVNGGSGSLFPAPTGGNYFMLTLISQLTGNMEIVQCTARSGDTFTIVRAQEGTTAQAFAIGDGVQLRITAGSLSAITNPVVVDSINGTAGQVNVSSTTGNVTISLPSTLTNINTTGVANGVAGGAANQILYQTGAGATSFLTTPSTANTSLVWNGTNFVWGSAPGPVATGAIYENKNNISANYTMTTGYNGSSAGPITINTGVTVTIPTGSRWAIV